VTVVLYEAPMKNNHNKSKSTPWEVQAAHLVLLKDAQSTISEKFEVIQSYSNQRKFADDEFYAWTERMDWQRLIEMEVNISRQLQDAEYYASRTILIDGFYTKDEDAGHDVKILKFKLQIISDAIENYDPLHGRDGCREGQLEDANDERY
jgi:hypothetical protein